MRKGSDKQFSKWIARLSSTILVGKIVAVSVSHPPPHLLSGHLFHLETHRQAAGNARGNTPWLSRLMVLPA
jgi:hypothetical protein